MKISVLLAFLLVVPSFQSQELQTLRGRIQNSDLNPVSEVTVQLLGNSNFIAVSDSNGFYSAQVPAGKYVIYIKHPEYKAVQRENIVVVSSKQQIQDFELPESKNTFEAVPIIARSEQDIELDPYNIQQYAAVFYDPVRVATVRSAVVNTNDQSNHISVRGTSPNYIQWKLEGVEIVNPNHLENSGTMNDRPSLNGGGVSMISAQLLDNSGFIFAPSDGLSGNFLSGLFEIKLRRGNNERRERIVQISLLGTDLSLEGPLGKNKNSSYLVNFRYSTIGFLSKMGVNFGNERSSFMDFSHVLTFPHKRGIIKLFGIAGSSETRFASGGDSTLYKTQKDLQDINYDSFTNIQGVSFITTLSNTMFIKSVFAYSNKTNSRDANWVSKIPGLYDQKESFDQEKLSSLNYLTKRIGNSFRIKAGSYVNHFYSAYIKAMELRPELANNISEVVIQPFISVEQNINEKLEVQAGLHNMLLPRLHYNILLPRLSLRYQFNNTNEVAIRYGRNAQLQPFMLQLSAKENMRSSPSVNDAFSIAFDKQFTTNKMRVEVYLQKYFNLPEQPLYNFSSYNYFNEEINFQLVQSGKAQTAGIDLGYEKNFRGFYLISSVSIYNSLYFMNGLARPARFSTNYNGALTTGKEFILKNKNKTFSIDLRGFAREGFRHNQNDTVFEYATSLPTYARVDLRLSYKINKQKSSHIWAIDVQNVTNRKNAGYRYFDRYTNKTETQYQLGLIPVLSYKVLF